MTTKDLGIKRTCQNCGAKFYDFKKKDVACPKCETEYMPEKPKTRRAAAPVAAPEPVQAKAANESKEADSKAVDSSDKAETESVAEEVEDIEIDNTASDDDNTLIEDTSDIGGDEEDIAGVAVNVDNGDKD